MNHIDKFFAQKLQNAEVKPRTEAWKRVQQGLALQKEQIKNRNLTKWVLIFFLLGTIVGSSTFCYLKYFKMENQVENYSQKPVFNKPDGTNKNHKNKNEQNITEKNIFENKTENLENIKTLISKSGKRDLEMKNMMKIEEKTSQNNSNNMKEPYLGKNTTLITRLRTDFVDSVKISNEKTFQKNSQDISKDENDKKNDTKNIVKDDIKNNKNVADEEVLEIKVKIKLSKSKTETPQKNTEKEAKAQDFSKTNNFWEKAKKIKNGEQNLNFKIFGISTEKLFSTEKL
jgi:hypothetical protein